MYGVRMQKPRERFNMSLGGDTLDRIDLMAQNLQMTRGDVIEVITHFYFAYVGEIRHQKIMQKGKSA